MACSSFITPFRSQLHLLPNTFVCLINFTITIQVHVFVTILFCISDYISRFRFIGFRKIFG